MDARAIRRADGGGAKTDPEHGFTLIEMLIVLAIIGVTTAMIRLGGGVLDRVSGNAGGSGEASETLRRLARSTALASEQALVRGRPIVLELGAGRYRFFTLDVAGRWRSISDDPVFAERGLPDQWRWDAVQRDGEPLMTPYRLYFGNEPVRFEIQVAAREGSYVLRGDSLGAVDWAAR